MRKLFTTFQVLALLLMAGAVTAQVRQITPDSARAMALAGEIVLIDIREPDEWAETGLPDVALTAAMRSADFIETLLNIRDQNPDIPLALICQSGNRSSYMTGELHKAGLTNVIDVVEGMSGSRVGPGWAMRGLPMRRYNAPIHVAILTTQP
ncbi:MAG: rhodanese-like domain-containing protein [Rhodobacteraceae bacterium]|nr:rhodanese-like domain-containing protein [Paracoccaceae bacterium]